MWLGFSYQLNASELQIHSQYLLCDTGLDSEHFVFLVHILLSWGCWTLQDEGNSASWFWLLRFWLSSCSRWTVGGCRRPSFHPWVGNILWRRKWQPTPIFLPGEPRDRGAWRAKVHEQSSARWMFEDVWGHSALARYSEHSPWTNSQPHLRPSNHLPFR